MIDCLLRAGWEWDREWLESGLRERFWRDKYGLGLVSKNHQRRYAGLRCGIEGVMAWRIALSFFALSPRCPTRRLTRNEALRWVQQSAPYRDGIQLFVRAGERGCNKKTRPTSTFNASIAYSTSSGESVLRFPATMNFFASCTIRCMRYSISPANDSAAPSARGSRGRLWATSCLSAGCKCCVASSQRARNCFVLSSPLSQNS